MTRAVRFIKHQTYRTKSDHRANVATFGLLITPQGTGGQQGGLLAKSC